MKYRIVVVVFLSSLSLWSQSTRESRRDLEVFGGASYLRADIAPELEQFGAAHVNTLGWHASMSEYLNSWAGGTIDFSGNYGRPSLSIQANAFGPGLPPANVSLSDFANLSMYTAMAGPSVAYRKAEAWQPFAHVLLGVVHARASTTSKGAALIGGNIKSSDTVFGYALGGGVDIKVTSLVAIRGQADFIRSQFNDLGDDRQNNFRVSGGLVFRFNTH